MRIVTWNVNGIRRVHRDFIRQGTKKSFLDLLERLEGDIICIQELKSEKSTMDPVYVNVPGWRSYFSFPVDKKAYSGVAVYVREYYKPIKVETAICGPAYDRFFELENAEFIGGYPKQISTVEARQVDREGRAVVLDFGGFVMIGTYCPAGAESEERIAYRRLWWRALDERCRNLVSKGRQVILTGDLNVHCDALDQVDADEEEYKPDKLGPVGSTFYRLLHGISVLENSDENLPSTEPEQITTDQTGVFVDLSRHFFPEREKMFTCWSVKLAAREGNYGSRIDFVLATEDLLPYVTASDTRPDIHGSDHCPVYAQLDLASSSPPLEVSQAKEWESSGTSSNFTSSQKTLSATYFQRQVPKTAFGVEAPYKETQVSEDVIRQSPTSVAQKRKADVLIREPRKAQKSIAAFFTSKSPDGLNQGGSPTTVPASDDTTTTTSRDSSPTKAGTLMCSAGRLSNVRPETERAHSIEKRIEVSNAFATLFTKPEIPLCAGHSKPARLQRTKKKGANQGREFWMCSVPLGAGQCSFWKWRRK